MKMVLVTVIGILICTIAATTQHTNKVTHVNSMQHREEQPAECSDILSCNFCIPVSQPY